MKKIIFTCALALLTACAIPQGGMKRGGGLSAGVARPAQQQPQYFVDEAVEVLTEPAGARINVNDAFVGYSPVKSAARRYWRGEPGRMTLDLVKVEALPVAGSQCVQSGVFGQASGKVPAPVRFTMTDCAAQPGGKK